MVWLAVAALPPPSVAVHVRVTENSFAQRPGACTSLNVSWAVPLQSSVAAGEENTGCAGHSTVAGPPTPVITGGGVPRPLTDGPPCPPQPPALVTSSETVSVLLQACPACTVTDWPFAARSEERRVGKE